MSANGVHEHGTPYQRTKFLAEVALRTSGLEGTIFRPSVIFGDPRGKDEIASRLLREMVLPPLPAVAIHPGLLPARDALPMSPVHVTDVAAAFVAALHDPAAIGATFALGGPEAIGWREMITRVAAAVGRRKVFAPMPIGLMKLAAFALDRFSGFPVTRDQLTMLEQGNVADPEPLARLLGRAPRAFDAASLAYLRSASGQ